MLLEDQIQNQIKDVLKIVENGCSTQEWFDRYLPELEALLSLRDMFITKATE